MADRRRLKIAVPKTLSDADGELPGSLVTANDELNLTKSIRYYAPLSWDRLWDTMHGALLREVEWLVISERLDLLCQYGEIEQTEARLWAKRFQAIWAERSTNDYEMYRQRRILQLQELQNAAWREYRLSVGTKDAIPALNVLLKIIAEMGRFEGSYAPTKAQVQTSHFGVNVNITDVEEIIRGLIRDEPDERTRRTLLEVERRILTSGPEIIEVGPEPTAEDLPR